MSATLHLLMGLPGAGKTTLAKHIQSITKAARLSSDDYRVNIFPHPSFSQKEHDDLYAILNHSTEHLLASGRDVIYDANLNRKEHRQEKYHLAKKLQARVILWWVKTPETLAKSRRVAEQNSVLLPEGESAERMFERIAKVIEPPKRNEAHIVVDGTHITRETVEQLLATIK